MLPQSGEEALLFHEGLVAYAAARTSREGAEHVLLRVMAERHAEIITKSFRTAPEDHVEVEDFFRECIRLVQSEPPVARSLRQQRPEVHGDISGCHTLAMQLREIEIRSEKFISQNPKKVIADLQRALTFRS